MVTLWCAARYQMGRRALVPVVVIGFFPHSDRDQTVRWSWTSAWPSPLSHGVVRFAATPWGLRPSVVNAVDRTGLGGPWFALLFNLGVERISETSVTDRQAERIAIAAARMRSPSSSA